MTVEEIRRVDRETFKCEGCLGVMAGQRPTAEETTPEFKTKATKSINKLNILQWNADAILAKTESLRTYLEKMEVDSTPEVSPLPPRAKYVPPVFKENENYNSRHSSFLAGAWPHNNKKGIPTPSEARIHSVVC